MSEYYQQKKKYNEKYLSKMDEIRIRMSKESGLKDAIQAHAERRGESVQAFILRAIRDTMYNDTHPRTLDSERETMRRLFEQFHKAEGA